MKYNFILFDLDGTLTDPIHGISNSILYALAKMGIAPPEKDHMTQFIGPPLFDTFSKYFKLSKEDSNKGIELYREYFANNGLYENSVYDHIPQLLSSLRKTGLKLLVATSKPTPFAEKILDHFGLSQYFLHICGSNLDNSRSKKADVISHALSLCDAPRKSGVVMIGDRSHDIVGALETGIDSIGVTYGYGTRDELSEATHIVDSVQKLAEMLGVNL